MAEIINRPEHPAGALAPRDSESTMDLLSGLVHDARDLAVAHVDGMRLEVREELGNIKQIARRGAIALALLAVGGLLLSHAIALLLALVLPAWAAYAIVAGVMLAIGIAAALAARSKVGPQADLVPERSLERARHDARWVADRTREAVATS